MCVGAQRELTETKMTQILRLTRAASVLMPKGHEHLGAGATQVRTERTRVTRAEISILFAAELGYRRREQRAGL